MSDTYRGEIEAWRKLRLSRLQAEDGWLNIIGRWPLEVGVSTLGIAADNTIQLDVGPEHAGTFDLGEDSGLIFTPVDGEPQTVDTRPGSPKLEAGRLLIEAIGVNGATVLRIRDRESPARHSVTEIPIFPIDPDWRIVADWVELKQPFEVEVENVVGAFAPAKVTHKAVFEHEGKSVELYPTHGSPTAPHFVFRDQTAGETYPASRFLFPEPKGTTVVLDFNKAVNPPCAFSAFTTCPLPIPQNILPFRVEAGELRVKLPD